MIAGPTPLLMVGRLQVAFWVNAFRTTIVAQTGPTIVQIQCITFPPCAEQAVQCALERFSEVTIEIGVDKRIQCWIEIANPE